MVVDSGDGCTHIIPVVDGFVISSAIRTVPLAGRDVTQHVQQLLRCVCVCRWGTRGQLLGARSAQMQLGECGEWGE